MLTQKQLQAMHNCAPMLPEPGDAVVVELIAEINRLRSVLKDIIDPLARMTRELPEGEQLNGFFVNSLVNDAEYLRDLARAAIPDA